MKFLNIIFNMRYFKNIHTFEWQNFIHNRQISSSILPEYLPVVNIVAGYFKRRQSKLASNKCQNIGDEKLAFLEIK